MPLYLSLGTSIGQNWWQSRCLSLKHMDQARSYMRSLGQECIKTSTMTSPMAIGFDAVPATTRVQGRSTRPAFSVSDTRAILTLSAPLFRRTKHGVQLELTAVTSICQA